MPKRGLESEEVLPIGAVLNAMIDGIMITDINFKILQINEKAEEMFGYEEEEIVGKPFYDLISGRNVSNLKSSLLKAITDNSTEYMEFKGIKKEGEDFPIRINGTALRDKEDSGRYIISIKDTTNLVKANEELEDFIYTVSHDLRTPLISIKGFSDLLEDEFGGELGSEGKNYLNRIQSGVEKIDNFLNDLLLLSRIGRKSVLEGEVKLENLIDDIREDLSAKIEEVGAEIKVEGELPKFYFEKKRLNQLVSNLVSNAVKFLGDQDNPLVRIGAEDKGNSWVLWVEDNGIGIEPENRENVFDIFFQEQRVDEEGTGIGLSIAKRIVEDYNGKIWVESEKGRGSTFYVEFPKEEVQKQR